MRSPAPKSATVASGAKPRSTSSSSRMPQVSASRCVFQTQQEAEGRGGIDAHQDGIVRLEDLIEETDVDGGEVVLLVDPLGIRDGAVHDVVHGPQGDRIIEEVAEQFDDAAGRTMADQDQAQDQLPQPGRGDRQVEEDLVGRCRRRGEGLVEGLLGGVDLLREELSADLLLPGQRRDRFGAGEDLDGQISPLLGEQPLGRPVLEPAPGESRENSHKFCF